MIPGIDVSVWDGDPNHLRTLNWDAYTWPFGFVKVSEGTVIDPLFRRQWAAARGYTLRSAYHFFRPSVDPKQSVIRTIEYLDGDVGELPLAFDLETTDGMSNVLDRAKSWLSWYEEFTGIRPIIYSNPGFLDTVVSSRYPFLANYKLWDAEYPFDKMEPAAVRNQRIADVLSGAYLVKFPVPRAPFKRVSFWQWTALGKPDQIPGYYTGADGKKEVDLIFYHGSLQDLLFEFNVEPGSLPTPLPPTGDPMPEYVYSITPSRLDGSAVRPEPETGNTKLTISLPYGKFAYGNKKFTIAEDKYEVIGGVNTQVNRAGDVWLEVLEVNGTPMSQLAYIAETHLGVRYATIKQIGTVPTDPPVDPPTEVQPFKISIGGDGYQVLSVVQTGNVVDIELKPTA